MTSYVEHPDVAKRSQDEIDKWISENELTLTGTDIPRPIFEFKESTFPEAIVDLLYANYQKPTPIQSVSWSAALGGRDVISIARTGSGKTHGFMLPGIIHTIKKAPRLQDEGPSVLVLLPTRELAQQVEEVSRDYCKAMKLNIACLYGGASKTTQVPALRRGIDICVATPGRLIDFLEHGDINLDRCTFVVLDEADRMLDMGFEPQIKQIIEKIPNARQTLMFSATWPKDVRDLAAKYQRQPVFLNVGSLELAANHNITQHIEVIDERQKSRRLVQLLREIGKQVECKTLVFVETKRRCDELTRVMRGDGWPVLCIHGDKSQTERDWVMNEFRTGKTPILLATDVASRGLDVTDIKYVINYDYPKNSEDYVHRIGRTARRDLLGISHTFFTFENAPKAKDLIKVLEEAKQAVPSSLADLANGGGFPSSYSRSSFTRGFGAGSGFGTRGFGNGKGSDGGISKMPNGQVNNQRGGYSTGVSSNYRANGGDGGFASGSRGYAYGYGGAYEYNGSASARTYYGQRNSGRVAYH